MTDNILKERAAPRWRVLAYIKDPVYGTNRSRRFVELKGFKNVSTNTSMSGQGTANITFPDHKSSLMRFVSMDSIASTESAGTGSETTNGYAFDWLSNVMSDSTSNYFKGSFNDTVVSRGDLPFYDQATLNFLEYSRSRGNVLSTQELNAMKTLKGTADGSMLIYALPFIDLFDPIFVDAMGQDGFWYAKFTGFVTRTQDSYSRTGAQELQISCKDMSLLLDNASVITAWNKLSVAEKKSTLNDYVYASESNLVAANEAAYSSIFADESITSVQDIILKIIRTAQEMWRMDKFGDDVGVKAFMFDTTKAYSYEGISGRRGSIQHVQYEDSEKDENPEYMNPKLFTTDYDLKKQHWMYDSNSGRGKKKILIDPMLKDFDNKFIHKTLSNGLALYRDSMKSADAIIADLVSKMMAFRYFDGNGNLVIECPKLNAMPNLTSYGGRSVATALRYSPPDPAPATATTEQKTVVVKAGDNWTKYKKLYNVTKEEIYNLNGGENNRAVFFKNSKGYVGFKEGATIILGKSSTTEAGDPLALVKNMWVTPSYATILANSDTDWRWSTLRFHGKNYVLTNDDFISFTSALDEGPIYTVSAMDAVQPQLAAFEGNLVNSEPSLHGVAVADYDKLAKVGVRRFQTQSIYNVRWPSRLTGTRVLSYMAATVLERANAQAESGSMVLNHRPDLQLGRTYINLLRMKSYLIIGITDSWNPGGSHTTSLTLGYGHPIHKTVSQPWSAIFVQPEVFAFEGGVSGFEKINNVTAEGNERKLSETYVEPNTTAQEGVQA